MANKIYIIAGKKYIRKLVNQTDPECNNCCFDIAGRCTHPGGLMNVRCMDKAPKGDKDIFYIFKNAPKKRKNVKKNT